METTTIILLVFASILGAMYLTAKIIEKNNGSYTEKHEAH